MQNWLCKFTSYLLLFNNVNFNDCRCTPVIYVSGGDRISGCGPAKNTVNIFDLTNKRWCAGVNLPQPLSFHGQSYFQKKVYIVGGSVGWCSEIGESNKTYSFDPIKNMFAPSAPLSKELWNVNTAVVGKSIYMIGRKAFSSENGSTAIFNGVQWRDGPSMISYRQEFAFAAWKDSIFAIGGAPLDHPPTVSVNTLVEIWNTKTNKWTVGIPTSSPRIDASAAVIGNSIYVCGGYKENEKYLYTSAYYEELATCECLILNNDGTVETKWSPVASMKNTRSRFNLVVYNGKLLAFGGSIQFGGSTKPIEQYDPTKNTWTPFTTVATPADLSSSAATVIDDFPTSATTCGAARRMMNKLDRGENESPKIILAKPALKTIPH